MKNFIQLGKEKIEISEETAQNLKEQFGKRDLVDRTICQIRVSEAKRPEDTSYPLRLSILNNYKQGMPPGEFGDSGTGSLPGYTLCIKDAIKVRNTIDEIIQNNDC